MQSSMFVSVGMLKAEGQRVVLGLSCSTIVLSFFTEHGDIHAHHDDADDTMILVNNENSNGQGENPTQRRRKSQVSRTTKRPGESSAPRHG